MTDKGDEEESSRFQTEVPGLDALLGGGFYEGGLYLMEGLPGAGKTVLASQLSFKQASRGKTIVYLTLIAESHAKLISHLRTMRFFRRAHLGEQLHLLSGYQELRKGGHRALLELIANIVHEQRPYLMIIDGFRQGNEGPNAEIDILSFVHDLSAFAMAARCTILILTPYCRKTRPEDALVDGLIELTRRCVGMRTVREIEVHKMRAAAHVSGKHFFNITADGLTIYRRLESAVNEQVTVSENAARLKFDIPKLDAMLGGGLFKGSVTLLAGSPGSGKTLLGLAFLLAGSRAGQPALYFGFYEPPARLVAKASGVGLDPQKAITAGLLEILWQPPTEELLDDLAYKLLDAVDRRGAQRVFIDGVEGFRNSAVYPERISRFMTALTVLLRAKGATVILSEELPIFPSEVQTPVTELSAIVENLILMRQVELRAQLYRLISIMKLRESGYDSAIREFTISPRGIDVAGSFESAEAILTGQARILPRRKAKPSRGTGRNPSRRRK